MIPTDSGAWILQEKDKGKVKLRAVLKHEIKERTTERIWEGTIETPAIKVEWKE